MKRRFHSLLLALLLGSAFAALPPVLRPALAAEADYRSTPLMVIRFNQPRVYYERPLYNALQKALQVKPDVRLNVINYFPTRTPRQMDEAEKDLKAVVRTLGEMGMPLARIGVASEPAADLEYSEVHIYVR